MKKFFRYLAAALLVSLSFAAASCSDDPEEPAPTPQFPTPQPQQTILPGESSTFTIKPNMDWVVSIPEEARNWFYLDDNGTKVSKLRGAAVVGDQSITVKIGAENVELFDPVQPVEVTLTMGNPAESKTIATFVIQQKERELKFYMVKTENGEYVYNEDTATSPLQYSYEAEAKTESSVQLELHGGAFYGARLLVESNVPWAISVPDWIEAHVNAEAATSGAAGQSEVELRADYAKMPLEGAADVACSFNATAADGSVVELAKIAVSLENLTGLLEYDLPKEALFSARGNYLVSASTYGALLSGSITAPDGVQVIAIAKAIYGGYEEWMGQPWVKAEIDPWSGEDKIQNRTVSISLEPNTGNMERQAVVFVLPASLKDKTMFDLLTEDMYDIREEYKQYLATTVTQEASKFLLNPQNSLAMKAQGVKFEDGYEMFDSTLWQWCDWMHNSNDLYYKLTYTNEYSADGGAIDVVPLSWCPAYTSYKIYGYNAGSAGENLPADNKWIKLQEARNPETNVVESFTVQMNFDKEYKNTYGDGKGYAAVVFYDETGTAIATLECTFDDGSGSGGGATGSVNFAYPQYAQMEGSSIEQLSAGDTDYDKYAGAYADFAPTVYRVTFTTPTPTMSMIAGLPNFAQWCEVIDGAEWLSRPEPGMEVTFAGYMNSDKSTKGAYIFYTGGSGFDEAQKVIDPQGPAVILVINLVQ